MINFIGTRHINFNSKVGPFLEKIYGIGSKGARIICLRSGIPYNVLFSDLTEDTIESIDSSVRFFFVSEPELKRRVSRCLRIRIRSGCYRGVRLSQGLPSRGQRSRTNARTIRALREKIFIQVKQDLFFTCLLLKYFLLEGLGLRLILRTLNLITSRVRTFLRLKNN
jgi:small subunit ribosomal protein S13